jgi:hypothetical protein
VGFPSTQGYGHSTVTMACEVAFTSGAGQLVLFHHDPTYSDTMVAGMEIAAKSKFHDTRAAYEGLELILQESNTIAKQLQSPILPARDVKYANHDRHTTAQR